TCPLVERAGRGARAGGRPGGAARARRRDRGRIGVHEGMPTGSGLAGRRVGITADRRWRAQADLLENLGAEVLHGPTLRTVDLTRDETLHRATLDLIAVPPDVLVASTGMGVTMWLEAADSWELAAPLREALRGSRI